MNTFTEDISYIAPYIYIGNRYASYGRLTPEGPTVYADYLRKYNIRCAISVLTEEEYEDYMIEAADFADQARWHRLVADDDPQEPISRFFPQMTDVIAEAVAARHPTLIHCAAGMSRSVTIVAAYLIAERGMSAAEAVAFIKKRRPFAQPNDGFMAQLEAWRKLKPPSFPTFNI